MSLRPSPSVQPPSMTPSPRSPTLVTRSISSPQVWILSLPATWTTLPLSRLVVLVWPRESCHPCLVHLRVCARANSNSPTVLTSPDSHSYSWGRRESSHLRLSPSALLTLLFAVPSRVFQMVPSTRSHSPVLRDKCSEHCTVHSTDYYCYYWDSSLLPLPHEHMLSSPFLRPLLMCCSLFYYY